MLVDDVRSFIRSFVRIYFPDENMPSVPPVSMHDRSGNLRLPFYTLPDGLHIFGYDRGCSSMIVDDQEIVSTTTSATLDLERGIR